MISSRSIRNREVDGYYVVVRLSECRSTERSELLIVYIEIIIHRTIALQHLCKFSNTENKQKMGFSDKKVVSDEDQSYQINYGGLFY